VACAHANQAFNEAWPIYTGALMSKTRFAVCACAFMLCFADTGARAATPAPTRAPAVQAVIDCRKLADSAQRLACYDATVDSMAKAETAGDLVTLDRAQRRAVRRQAFGFTLPTLSMFDRGEKPDEVDRIDETLASARQDAQGKWTFVMQDGAVWRQIDDEFLSRKPHQGSAIVIRRAMLGSYMLSVDGQPGVRAHRDN
jgi:hypothetical protein